MNDKKSRTICIVNWVLAKHRAQPINPPDVGRHCTLLRLGYYLGMHISTGTVVGGKIVVEGLSLPEGTVVTVLTPEDDKIVKLAPELEKELIAAIDEADQEVGGAGPEFIESLKRYG